MFRYSRTQQGFDVLVNEVAHSPIADDTEIVLYQDLLERLKTQVRTSCVE
jgi:hypothetical protein